jgi:hypothetical protein
MGPYSFQTANFFSVITRDFRTVPPLEPAAMGHKTAGFCRGRRAVEPINTVTAKKLGWAVPALVLARAERVIE